MYLSKIWFFMIASAAAVALTFALVMPRPAERQALETETGQLQRACKITTILMEDNARIRVQLAGEFARTGAPKGQPSLRLDKILFEASKGGIVSLKENKTGSAALEQMLSPESFKGVAPDFMLLLDNRGRVVARRNADKKGNDKFGQSMRGYFLVDESIAGYLRDDLWIVDGKLFRVAGSPVVTSNDGWAGAFVMGHAVDDDFVASLTKGLGVSLGFYAGGSEVATSLKAAITKDVLAKAAELEALEPGTDCDGEPFQANAGGKTYSVLLSRLPGEAGELGSFFSVFVERKAGRGFWATVTQVTKGDLSFSNFPWIAVILLFILMVGIGLSLMIWESDRPLRRLTDDAQRLSKGGDKLVEEQHSGKFGSIARSVNVALDRLRREAKSAQKDLDDLLGPAPGGGAPMPAVGPAAFVPPPPPPPSEFKFSDSAPAGPPQQPPPQQQQQQQQQQAMSAPPLNLPVPPPPANPSLRSATDAQVKPRGVGLPGAPPVVAPLQMPESPTEALTVERMTPIVEDMPTIVSEQSQKLADNDAETLHFRDIYEEFLNTKRSCGEPSDNLNFERFATKLRKNRDALIAKHGCRSVRFQVYIKEGKAALKASPEK